MDCQCWNCAKTFQTYGGQERHAIATSIGENKRQIHADSGARRQFFTNVSEGQLDPRIWQLDFCPRRLQRACDECREEAKRYSLQDRDHNIELVNLSLGLPTINEGGSEEKTVKKCQVCLKPYGNHYLRTEAVYQGREQIGDSWKYSSVMLLCSKCSRIRKKRSSQSQRHQKQCPNKWLPGICAYCGHTSLSGHEELTGIDRMTQSWKGNVLRQQIKLCKALATDRGNWSVPRLTLVRDEYGVYPRDETTVWSGVATAKILIKLYHVLEDKSKQLDAFHLY
jgi:hypothetical protein